MGSYQVSGYHPFPDFGHVTMHPALTGYTGSPLSGMEGNYLSGGISTGISLAAAGLFLVATLAGNYTLVERIGGVGWVFLLSMIILMPIITPVVKKRLGS